MKFPPKGSVLRALAAGRVGWSTAIGEWIDNSFDRHATRIAVTFERDTLTIVDDGDGTASPPDIVQLGEHTKTSEGLGEFGLGGKESLLWAGGEKSSVEIVSTHKRITRRLNVNWLQFADGDWELPDPDESPAAAGEIGTRIVVRPLKQPPPKNVSALCEELGYLYSRALRHLDYRKQITIKSRADKHPRVVEAWRPPEFSDTLPQVRGVVVSVGNKEAVVWAGVVKDGVPNPKFGLTYFYRYRVVLQASARGCGNYHVHRVCGFVELREGWKSSLTRNKNGLTVDDEALFAEIERVITPVLMAGEQAGSTVHFRDLSARLESQVATILDSNRAKPDAKAKRSPGDRHGTIAPVDSGRTHTRAKRQQPGERFTGNQSGLKVAYAPLGGEKLGVAKPPNITLNLDNKFIAQAVSDASEQTLLAVIIALVVEHDANADKTGQRYLPGLELKPFSEMAGAMLAKSPVLDGRPAMRAVS